MDNLSIGKISKLVDLPAKTIRFYEEQNLLKKVSRKQNSYRQFSAQNIEELKVIKYARSLGFSLSQIKSLLQNPENLDKFISETISSLEEEIKILKNNKLKLASLKKELTNSRLTCTGDDYCCNIFYQTLKQKTKGGENK